MRAQISIEFLVNLLIWFSFITILSIGLLSLNDATVASAKNHEKNSELAKTALLAEQIQNTGFTVLIKTSEFKYKNGTISVEISGKEIVFESIYRIEDINGKPV